VAAPLIEAVYEALPGLVASDKPVSQCMDDVAALGELHAPHPGWNRFRTVDYGASVDALESWLTDALRGTPPQVPIHGLFLPLIEFEDRESPLKRPGQSALYAALRVAGSSTYDPALMWLGDQGHTPRRQYGHAPAFLAISRIANDEESSEMEWAMPLVFGVIAIRTVLSRHTSELVTPRADLVGVASGWEDEPFEIGQLRLRGTAAEPGPYF